MKKVGVPLNEVTTFFHDHKRVYRQKLKVNILESLKPKLPIKNSAQGIDWVYVVYENVGNICRFCATIGHDHALCPVRYRLTQMQNEEQYKEKLGDKPIPEINVGKWINDRTLIPREENKGYGSQESKVGLGPEYGGDSTKVDEPSKGDMNKKRPMDLNESEGAILFLEGDGSNQMRMEGGSGKQHLNFKRAKEMIPNSSPSSQ